jgi:hypothetical protein
VYELIEGRTSLACFSRQDSRKLRSELIDTASICFNAACWFCCHWNPTKILATLNSMFNVASCMFQPVSIGLSRFLWHTWIGAWPERVANKILCLGKSCWVINIVIAFCKMWGSHCNVNEDSGVLWYDTMSFGKLVTDVSGVSVISLCLHGWVVQEKKELIAPFRLIRPRR